MKSRLRAKLQVFLEPLGIRLDMGKDVEAREDIEGRAGFCVAAHRAEEVLDIRVRLDGTVTWSVWTDDLPSQVLGQLKD